MSNTKTRAPSQAEIEEFLANKAKKEAAEKKAKAKTDRKNSKSDRQAYFDRKKEAAKEAAEEFGNLKYQVCEFIKGKKIPLGTKCECVFIGVNRYLDPMAVVYIGDSEEPTFTKPAYLKPIKPMDKAKVARIEAERKQEAEETVLVIGRILREEDDFVVFHYSGWFGPKSFGKSLIETVKVFEDGTVAVSIDAWKIKADVGPDALDVLRSKQDEFAKAVAA